VTFMIDLVLFIVTGVVKMVLICIAWILAIGALAATISALASIF
jgi:hypothetical protein